MSRKGFSSHSREIREFASELGYQIEMTKSNHIKFRHPRGKKIVFTSGTPSDRRSYMNCRMELERNLRS